MNINELRAIVAKRERAANTKIVRNKREGVNIRGTEFDPVRRSGKGIDRMTTRELNAYRKRLDGFTDRGTQFVGGHKGVPLPREAVEKLKRYETARNIKVQKHYDSMSDVYIDPQGMTVGQRREMLKGFNELPFNMGGTGGQPDSSPYRTRRIDPKGIVDAKALKKLTDVVKKQTRKQSWLDAVVTGQRKNHMEFLDNHGQEAISERVKALSNRQFDLLMNATNYSNLTRFVYLKDDFKSERARARLEDGSVDEIDNLVAWVSKQ